MPRRRDGRSAARPPPNCAKRLECAQLAPAFECALVFDSASKLGALQTLRVVVHAEAPPWLLVKPARLAMFGEHSSLHLSPALVERSRIGPQARS